ncbi:hypothetical protein [Streptomyces sp. NPDC017958]|uniref:hypothetical protein n=1 Tax=Streptomyces sp. NPDC017958 TaxID=3365021 RepID=UPI003787E08E
MRLCMVHISRIQEMIIMALEPGDAFWYWDGRISRTKNIPQGEWFDTSAPQDYGGHGWEISNFVYYPEEILQGQPQMRTGSGSYSWLNNNPGNITFGGADFGAYPGKLNWHNFLIFPSWDAGRDAICQLMRTPQYSGLSILSAFQRYAPASDGNDPVRYANQVASELGTDVSTIVGDLSDDDMTVLENAVTDLEGVVAGWSYTHDDTSMPQAVFDLVHT